MKTFHIYLQFRSGEGKWSEETETVSADTAGDALNVAAGRWPTWPVDGQGRPVRTPVGHQVWEWDGHCETLVTARGDGHVIIL